MSRDDADVVSQAIRDYIFGPNYVMGAEAALEYYRRMAKAAIEAYRKQLFLKGELHCDD